MSVPSTAIDLAQQAGNQAVVAAAGQGAASRPENSQAGGEAPVATPHQPAATEPLPEEQAANQPMAEEQAATGPMPDQSAAAPEPMAAEEPPVAAATGAPVHAADVIGTDVVNSNGDEVGTIDDLVIDANQVEYAVISVGGFLGIGDKAVAIPLDQLTLGEDESYLLSAQTVDQLKEMPEYDESQYQPRG